MVDKGRAEAKLNELKKEYSKTKHNKATNKHLGILRAKIATVKRELEAHSGKRGMGYAVRKSGNATVVLAGFPNAGKSSLLKALTGVESKVADYAFTTLDVVPGMMNYQGAKIQILDLPGLIQGAHIGKGGGLQVISVIRIADLVLFVIDINSHQQLYKLDEELGLLNIRINKRRPRIRIEKAEVGGMIIEANGHTVPPRDIVLGVLNEFKIFNGQIIFYEDTNEDMLIDFVSDACVYTRGVVALNKIDTVSRQKVDAVSREISAKMKGIGVIPISAKMSDNIESLKKVVFDGLGLVRVYLKPRDGEPDFENPMVVGGGATVMDIVRKINSKLLKDARFAYITGPSAKFQNQRMGLEHQVKDGDIVTVVFD